MSVDISGDNLTKLLISMLIGQFEHNLDAKNRISIPAKLRGSIGTKVIVTRGLDNCLFVLSQKEWKKLIDKIGNLPLGQKDARGLARIMMAGAMEVAPDRLGRVVIPDYLKRYASLKKEAVITGVGNRLEIWAKTAWDLYCQKGEDTLSEMAERLEL